MQKCIGPCDVRHHTKDKCAIGVAQVIANLTTQGYQVCVPISEHLPFDLVGVSPDGMVLRRIQAKVGSLKDGAITVNTKASGLNAQGAYSRSRDLSKIDAFAIYCPETSEVYYINVEELHGIEMFSFRINLAVNNQTKNVRLAQQFTCADRIFGPP